VQVTNIAPADAVAVLSDAVPGLGVRAQERLRMVTLRGSAAAVAEGKRLLQQIDVATPATRAVTLKNRDADQVRELILSTYPSLNVQSHAQLGSLIISGPKPLVDEAVSLVNSVDVALPAGAGVAPGMQEIVETKYVAPKTAAEALKSIPGVSVSIPPADAKGDRRVVISGPGSAVAQARALLEKLDVPPRQVMIEAMVTDFSSEDINQTGVSWDLGTIGITETRNTAGFKFGTFTRTGIDALGVISASLSKGTSKILAQPRILALDGQTARVLSGQRILIQTQQIIAGAVTTTIQEVRVGIELEITPTITSDGYVVCTVKPQVSNIQGYTPQALPIIASREAESTARLADGQTLVIGGLIKDEEVRSLTRVPFLSEVPILGEFFKRRTVDKRPSELVIFVTPRVVTSEGGRL